MVHVFIIRSIFSHSKINLRNHSPNFHNITDDQRQDIRTSFIELGNHSLNLHNITDDQWQDIRISFKELENHSPNFHNLIDDQWKNLSFDLPITNEADNEWKFVVNNLISFYFLKSYVFE